MIYVGHFSFDEIGKENQARHGYFTCLVEDAEIDRAMQQFKDRIIELKQTHEALRPVAAVYIEDILEFEQIPDRPVITRLQSSEGPFPKSISRTLPDHSIQKVQAYGYRPDVDQNQAGGENFQEMTPFLKF